MLVGHQGIFSCNRLYSNMMVKIDFILNTYQLPLDVKWIGERGREERAKRGKTRKREVHTRGSLYFAE